MKEKTLNGVNSGILFAVYQKLAKELGLKGAEFADKYNKSWQFRREITNFILSLIGNKKRQKIAYEMPMDILGENNFITPEKITKKTEIKYSESQMALIYASLPQDEGWFKTSAEKNIILHPGTSYPMNLFDVRDIKPSNFHSEEGTLWTREKEKEFLSAINYANYANLQGYENWYALKKTAVECSLGKTWQDQQELILPDEFVPNVAQLAFSMSIIEQVVGIYLFSHCYMKTDSKDLDGCRLCLGYFDGRIRVKGSWDHEALDIGLSVYRKLFPVDVELLRFNF